jgi:hypothetical protein
MWHWQKNVSPLFGTNQFDAAIQLKSSTIQHSTALGF